MRDEGAARGAFQDGVFSYRIRVGWGDCDPAQIAYTARLPDFGLQTIDAWWEALMGYGWYEMNRDKGFGTPFVHLSCDFRAPVTPRHPLICKLKPVKLGTRSLEFDFAGFRKQFAGNQGWHQGRPQRMGSCRVTSLVPSGKTASICTSCTSSATPSIT